MAIPLAVMRRESEQEKRRILPSQLVEMLFPIDSGERFSFEGREYWLPIYNSFFPKVLIISSRQAEKSTYQKNKILAKLIMTPGLQLLYAAAFTQQVKDFSRKKVWSTFLKNRELMALYIRKNLVNNVFQREFSNGSMLYMRAIAVTVESARGGTYRDIHYDEIQSIQSDHIYLMEESTSSFTDSQYVYTGTPLSEQNLINTMWKESTMNEWIIKCPHCGKWQEPLGMQHIDPSKPYLFCQYCGKEMSARNGVWVSHNANGKYPGFRIVRLMVPNATWRTPAGDGILDKYEKYGEQQFANEVMALSWRTASEPITEEELIALCDPNLSYDSPELVDISKTGINFAGLDWAMDNEHSRRSYTKLGIFTYVNDQMVNVFKKRYTGTESRDSDYVNRDIARICNEYNVAILGTDYGVGHKENQRLMRILPNRVYEFMYTNVDSDTPIWNAKKLRYDVNRTKSIDWLFTRLKRGRYRFPRWVEAREELEDVLHEYQEYDFYYRKMRYDHKEDEPDDFLHVLNYAEMVKSLYYGEYEIYNEGLPDN